MKNLILLLLLLAGLEVQSQELFGFSLGVNLNDVASDYANSDLEVESKFRTGFHIGLVAQFELSDEYALQTGLLYNSKGFQSDEDNLQNNEFDIYRLDYLELPLNLIINLSSQPLNAEKPQLFAFAGPYVALGIGGKNDYKINGRREEISLIPKFGTVREESSIDENSIPFNALDYGIKAGVGLTIDNGTIITAGYSFGLANINNDLRGANANASIDDFKDFHRVLYFSYTVLFD